MLRLNKSGREVAIEVLNNSHITNQTWYNHLLRIQRTIRRHIIDLNTSPLLNIAIMKRRPQPTLTLRHRQPKPEQMPPHPLAPLLIQTPRRPVLVRRASVQHVPVRQELNVSRLENHMQREARRRLVQNCESALLRGRERRDHSVGAGVEAREGGHVVRVEFQPDAWWGASGVGLLALCVEDAGFVPGVLARADFAFAVEVPVGRGEGLHHVGVLVLQGVVQVVRGDDVGFPTGEGFGDAEEADEVGAVGVKVLSGECVNGSTGGVIMF